MSQRDTRGNRDDELSFCEQCNKWPRFSLRQQLLAAAALIWVDSAVASTLKQLIVRLALCEKISPETGDLLIRWLRLKHA